MVLAPGTFNSIPHKDRASSACRFPIFLHKISLTYASISDAEVQYLDKQKIHDLVGGSICLSG